MDGIGSDEHIRRERERGRDLRQSRWWQNLIASSTCHYCQKPLTKATATMDHILPLSLGGASTRGNVVPACKGCNNLKRDQSAVEWALAVKSD